MNQKTRVRVDAFPFARYGELDGYVTKIGADALRTRFTIKLLSLSSNT